VRVTVDETDGTVVFLHRIAEGAADRSYGIHVAKLAGLPDRVLARAREVLAELERERTVEPLESSEPEQLPLFAPAEPHPLEEALRSLEVESLTPLEALNRLRGGAARGA